MTRSSVEIQEGWHNIHNPGEWAVKKFREGFGCIVQAIIGGGIVLAMWWLSETAR